jgi:hypothetical protein
MAAGLGYKDFLAGSVLTAADTNGYLASQANMVFATAAARDAAITSPQEGMIAVLKDSDGVFMYNGTAWIQDSGVAVYTTFTPTLTGWTLGNGTFLAYYRVFGKSVHYYGRFTFGSTSAVGGSGTTFTVTLPETSRFGVESFQTGVGKFRDISVGLNVIGQTTYQSTTTMTLQWSENPAATTYVSGQAWNTDSSLPFTFATGDFVSWDIVYERA